MILAALTVAIVGCGGSSSGHSAASTSGGPPGALAAVYVQDSRFTSLEVDVYWTKGAEPDPAALALLQRRLAQHVKKPEGVTVALARELNVAATSAWSVTDSLQVDAEVGPARESAPLATMRVIYLSGESEKNEELGDQTLGMGITASTFVVFKHAIAGASQGAETTSDLEGAVLVHEAGHLLGLVNLGAPLTSAHEDPYRRSHCTTSGCVMQASSAQWTIAGGAADYCAACVGDLETLGGR